MFIDPQAIDRDEELCNAIFKSKLLQCLSKNLSFDADQNLTEREKLALEMIVNLVKIHDRARKEIADIAPLNFQLGDSMRKALKTYKIIQDGAAFTSFLSKLKLQILLSSKDAKKIQHLARNYTTDERMYETVFKKTVQATNNDLILKINKHTA